MHGESISDNSYFGVSNSPLVFVSILTIRRKYYLLKIASSFQTKEQKQNFMEVG